MGLVISRTIERTLPGPSPVPVEAPELHALVQYVRAGRCALFVGAGLSAGAGLPTWDALMAKLIQRITRWAITEGTVPNSISIVDDAGVASRQSEVVAVRKKLGDARFNQLIAAIRRVRRPDDRRLRTVARNREHRKETGGGLKYLLSHS
jgi:hypothetical protein